jgi:8-oxo-dGTP pyrophosphatase MutT (NUDIX family)
MSSTHVQHDLLDWARAALSSWPVTDAAQAQLRGEYLAHLDRHPDALWREGPPAHLTASAFVLDPDRRHVLLTLHRKGEFWVQFGGHLEPGDATLSAAALREATEESGVDGLTVIGPADLHRHSLSAAFGRCREHLDAAYLVQAPYAARPTVTDESLDVAWWPVDDLPEAVVPDLPARLRRLLARH